MQTINISSIFDPTFDLSFLYERIKKIVINFGYSDEIEWQKGIDFEKFTESDLLREGAWVILCSGFREEYVRRAFDKVSLCFCDWESAKIINNNSLICSESALQIFGNKQKISAIAQMASMVDTEGFESVKSRVLAEPVKELQRFPFIGPITSYHLAKNLGFHYAKPDRHLIRIARSRNIEDVQELCSEIVRSTGELLSVVDIVLWRFASLITLYPREVEKHIQSLYSDLRGAYA